MELNDMLKEHEKRKDEEKRKHDDGQTILEHAVETELTTFMKLADEVILPILRHNEAKLNDRGYPAKIILGPSETHSGRQFYDKITFSFGTDKSVNDVSKIIIFERHDDATVLIKFIGEGQPEAKKCETTEFALKKELEEFFETAFR
jgi:hypothetical protein